MPKISWVWSEDKPPPSRLPSP